jgi:Xaa-Pro dipeptidase
MRERLVGLLLTADDVPRMIAPAFEVSNLSSGTWIDEILPWEEEESPYSLISDMLNSKTAGYSALLDNNLPLGVYWSLEKAVGSFKSTASLAPYLGEMRLIKNQAELDLIKKAGHIIDDSVMLAFNKAQLGMTEMELKQIVQNETIRLGAKPTFAAVQFGENSALPHAHPSTRELSKHDIVLLDCGCSLGGYNTDMTRVGVAGEPTDEQKRVHSVVEQKRVHSVVLKAEQTAIEKIAPGLACGKADGIVRRIIEESGYGEYFTHRLGHGIGIEVHEPPYLVRGNPCELRVGMTHSVEPGIYLEGKFGIRVEDLVCVKDGGSEVLTYSPRNLIQIDV